MSNGSKNLLNAWKRGTMIAGGFVLVAVLGGVLFRSAGVHATLQSWNLIPSPERYTELYFDRNLTLPTVVSDKPVTFEFSIHNVTGRDESYPYVVSVAGPSGSAQTLAHGTVLIANGATANVPEAVVLPRSLTSGEVIVWLPDQQQEIHFWLGAAK